MIFFYIHTHTPHYQRVTLTPETDDVCAWFHLVVFVSNCQTACRCEHKSLSWRKVLISAEWRSQMSDAVLSLPECFRRFPPSHLLCGWEAVDGAIYTQLLACRLVDLALGLLNCNDSKRVEIPQSAGGEMWPLFMNAECARKHTHITFLMCFYFVKTAQEVVSNFAVSYFAESGHLCFLVQHMPSSL